MARISVLETLTAMPRVSVPEWQAAPLLLRWLVTARAGVLIMTVASAAFGALLVARLPSADWLAGFVCLLGLLLAHAANNQLNDLTDSQRGIDSGNYFRTRYGAHVIEHGLLSKRGLLGYFLVTASLALLCGLWLLWRVDPWLLLPLVVGAVFLLFYTWPLKQWGLGELAVVIVWGPLMVAGTAWAVSGSWSWPIAVTGVWYALGPTTVIFGKHIDKLDFDAAKGVATAPVRLGELRSRQWVQGMLFLMYGGLLALVPVGLLPWLTLLAFLALPKALNAWRVLGTRAPDERPADYAQSIWPLWFSAVCFDHTRAFSMLALTGLAAAQLFA
ncbi:MAG: prenyltransferase [Pseudomonadota bacterium]